MTKKSRFSMLEVNDESTNSSLKKDESGKHESESKYESKIESKVKSKKIIIKEEAFKENLKHHQLKSKKKEIIHQKKIIESNILTLKRDAWIKIILGFFIIISTLRKFIWGTEERRYLGNDQAEIIITRSTLSFNDIILIILIIIFIYFLIFKKPNKKDS